VRSRLLREAFPEPPALDTAVSHALLRGVASGRLPAVLRLYRPGRVLAFGPRDRVDPGFADAVAAARATGFAPVLRLAGGRAAVFHEGTLAFSWVVPHPSPREGIRERFDETGTILVEAFRALGVDARMGEVPGEYCPGEHSVNARGSVKVAGVGQRIVAGAAHVGGVIVVEGAELVREALLPVYEALGLHWDPATAGSLSDEAPGITLEGSRAAIAERFATRFELEEGATDEQTLGEARSLLPRHAVA
jgi:octanoyl-[GcvH]:protein N-octanoyltransferase